MARRKKQEINNTWCSRCGCTFNVIGENDQQATIEEITIAKMKCPCCEEGRLAHVHADSK